MLEMIYILCVVMAGCVTMAFVYMVGYYKGKSDGRTELAGWVKTDLFKRRG